MKFTFSRNVRFVRFFGGFKIPEPMRFAFVRYVCAPFTLKKYDTHKTGFIAFIRFSNVLSVARFIYHTKVSKSVVMFDAVNVVNETVRPLTRHVKPRQTMRFVDRAFVANGAVPYPFFSAARGRTFAHTFRRSNSPRKNTCVRAVIQNLSKFVGRHLHLHIVVFKYIYPKTIGGQV